MSNLREIKLVLRCTWCKQFLSKDKAKFVAKDEKRETPYCPKCFEKGLDMEMQAMGAYEERYYL